MNLNKKPKNFKLIYRLFKFYFEIILKFDKNFKNNNSFKNLNYNRIFV